MRQRIKFGFIACLIVSHSVFSAEPVQGIYFGLLGQISHASNAQLNFTLDQPYTGQISLEPIGGGVGTSLGYKIKNFRLEGEFLFNINNFGELQVGSCTLISPKVIGPEGTCPAFIEDTGLGFNGNTMGFYGLFNVFYDFLSSDPNVNFVPYLGVGLGGAFIKNHVLIASNDQYISLGGAPILSFTIDNSKSAAAVQGILGFSYYLDDYTTLGMDFRYISTLNFNSNSGNSNSINSQFGISTLNITGTFALDQAE